MLELLAQVFHLGNLAVCGTNWHLDALAELLQVAVHVGNWITRLLGQQAFDEVDDNDTVCLIDQS